MATRQVIEGFPANIREVPEDREGWLRWRKQVLAFRELIHRSAEEDPEKREAVIQLAANDPAFFMAIFGVLYEPRNVRDMDLDDEGNVVTIKRKKGWYPWIPYPFQVRMIRWIYRVLDAEDDETGKGDGAVEKSRDVGASWLFTLVAAHQWLFDDDILIGFYSHKEDLVDSDMPKSLFYKARALLGLNGRVPERCHAPGTPFDGARVRLPSYLYPHGFEPKEHNRKLNLKHPTKTNQIMGESTTSKTAIGDRLYWALLDEGAKNDKFMSMWSGMGAVTDHRFVNSSADRRYGDGMFTVVEQARASQHNPDLPGPSFFSIPWNVIPLRDDAWYRRTKARYASEGNLQGFAREYEIDWNAGFGDWVYPIAQKIVPEHVPWSPTLGGVTGSIDPGIRDPTAVGMFQSIPGSLNREANLFDALILQTPSAAFLAPILMGWPPMHPVRADYQSEALQEFMDLMWEIRKTGYDVNWVGDPYGDNVGGANSDTYYASLTERSRELNEAYPDLPPAEIRVMTKYDEKARYHQKRKEAATDMIPRTHFNNTARVRHVVSALQNYRYKSQDESRAVQNEPNSPAHDWSCLEGNTAIRTLSGWKPIKDLVGRDDVWVWSYSEREQRLVPARAGRIWKSGENAPLVEVALDSGQFIRCTPEHRFMRRNGTWVEAKDLKEGDSLMPFYDHDNRGYTRVRLNDGSVADEHVYVYTRVYGMPDEGCHIHHKDGDKRNNHPDNLEAMTKEEHCRITKPQRGISYNEERPRFLSAKRYEKTCPVCETDFIGSYKQTYCSKSCLREMDKARRRLQDGTTLHRKTCVICEQGFETYDSRRKTCGDDCKKRHHQNQLNEAGRRRRAEQRAESEVLNHKVRRVTVLDETADVYDIYVPEYHNFVAEGVIVHNSHPATMFEYFAVVSQIADYLSGPQLKPVKMGRLKAPASVR